MLVHCYLDESLQPHAKVCRPQPSLDELLEPLLCHWAATCHCFILELRNVKEAPTAHNINCQVAFCKSSGWPGINTTPLGIKHNLASAVMASHHQHCMQKSADVLLASVISQASLLRWGPSPSCTQAQETKSGHALGLQAPSVHRKCCHILSNIPMHGKTNGVTLAPEFLQCCKPIALAPGDPLGRDSTLASEAKKVVEVW